MRVDKVMWDRADLVPVEPPVEPLAGPALDRIEEEQRPFSSHGLTLDSLHESETDALPLEVAMKAPSIAALLASREHA